MKKIILFFALLPVLAKSQSLIGGKNIIKANLSSLAFGNYHATFERSILKKMSLSVSYRYGAKKALPIQETVSKYFDDPNLNLGRFELGNSAITPELRLYLGLGKMKGFYIAPYARFATFDFTMPIKYTVANPLGGTIQVDADFTGKIRSTSGGVMFGTQYQILKKLVLDIWIVGGHYGTSTGELIADISKNPVPANNPLYASGRASLQSAIDGLSLDPFKVKGTIAADGRSATLLSDGPWAGVRALGFSLGLRF
jgi:hypothetical protein